MERVLAEFRRTVTENPFIPVTPTRRQSLFLTYPAQEILYGGAAGGGKSSALLIAALQYVTEPGYSALLLRRTFKDLTKPKALIPLSHDWLQGTKARWNDNEKQWTFPSGATLSFGYLASELDKYTFQGAAYTYVGWDELTQFTESQYRYLFSRRRKLAGDNIPARFRASSNPGGIGHEWVRRRFIDTDSDRRRFISAKLEDNPYLDKDDYEESLNELDPVTRAQLRHGDWEVKAEGNLFRREWFTGKVEQHAPPMVRRVRFWDLAASEEKPGTDPDFTAGCLMGLDAVGRFWVLEAQEFRATPAEVESRVKATAALDGRDVEVRIEQEPGASGKILIDHYTRTVLRGYAVYGERATGDKMIRAKPFSAACQNGLVWLLRGSWVTWFIDRLTSFGMPGEHDDTVDAAGGAHRGIATGGETISAEAWQRIISYDEEAAPEQEEELTPIERIRQRARFSEEE